jgi:putative ribosome biogenesis GTPase RsgA
MSNKFENVIIKGIAGFYYVQTANGLLETKAKGIFRKRGLTPLPGDVVELEEQDGSWVISAIHERKNSFVRPAVANVDVFFLIVSTVEPVPSTRIIDQLLTIALDKGAQVMLVVTKTDLSDGEELVKLYRESGDVAKTSAYCFDFIADTLYQMTLNAREIYGDLHVLFAGGVMSNSRIKSHLASLMNVSFSEPQFSADNAAGVALMTKNRYTRR